ncbi:MAG: helix-turn-helix domain-containing protein [Rhodocyclaceae bacterium]|nr:helix-turn-helix domain-containing protein [Rhodocyclaceae bacterium]
MIADVTHLEQLIGRADLDALVSLAGGLAVRIPKNPPFAGLLAELSLPAQEALARHAGGDVVYIPKCDGAARAARNREIVALYDAGVSVKEIARRHQLTERWVYEILGRPAEDRQNSLF